MAEQTPEDAGAEPSETLRRGAPILDAAADPALSAAIDAFARGDYRAAAAEAPASVPDVGDDRAWSARLHRALAWEPALWITAALCGAVWLWAFISAQPS